MKMTRDQGAVERRDVAAGLKVRAVAEDGPRFIDGRAVPYGVETRLTSWASEVIEPGAFRKSVQESARALPMLLHHDSGDWPVGVAREWTHLPVGLDGSWEMDDAERAAEAVRLADKGFLTGLSVGFVTIREEAEILDPDDNDGLEVRWHVYEARLVEVSLVATPAYADAGVMSVRSTSRATIRGRPRPHLVAARAWLDSVSAR